MLYLLDTCSYLRLAYSIHPLLGCQYYQSPQAAKVTSEVHSEWQKAPKLQSKFHWAGDAQFVSNRAQNLAALTGKQPTEILNTRRSIHTYSQMKSGSIKANGFTIPSPTDCAVLAYTLVLSESGSPATAVSDDGGMGWIANELQIPFITTLDLVHKMYSAKTQTIEDIKSLAGYLNYQIDLPPNWRSASLGLFGVQLP